MQNTCNLFFRVSEMRLLACSLLEKRAFTLSKFRFLSSKQTRTYQALYYFNSLKRTIHSKTNEESDMCSTGDGVCAEFDPVLQTIVTKREIRDGESHQSIYCSWDENPKSLSESRTRDKPSPSGSNKENTEKPRSFPSSSTNSRMSSTKKAKCRVSWVCSDCGESYGQWWGSCRACKAMGTLTEFTEIENGEAKTRGYDVSEKAVRSWFREKKHQTAFPKRLTDVKKGMNLLEWRIPLNGLFGAEVSRVLGGGLVPGSLVLIGGDPGVGKSTLLLQIAAILSEGQNFDDPSSVVYVSGEESIEQIGNRANRMRIGTEELYLYSSTDLEDILQNVQKLCPKALVVDSIQTVYLRGVTGSAGSVTQVKECTSALLRYAKQTNVAVLLIGHVTKTGDIAGPRVLEHIVDAVLYMEGERHSSHRLLRAVKNRFGSTDELGIFEMSHSGLQAVSNPCEIFLSDSHFQSEVLAGLAVAVILDESRAFLVEVQALCSTVSNVTRHVNGIAESRADMIISVLMKQAGLKLQDNAIFLNVISGIKLSETAGDLAIAAAICSSFMEFPIPNGVAFIGEIGLGGELRTVPQMDKRVYAVAKLGYKKCVIPKVAERYLSSLELQEMEIVGCRNLKEVIHNIFVE